MNDNIFIIQQPGGHDFRNKNRISSLHSTTATPMEASKTEVYAETEVQIKQKKELLTR